MLGKKVRYIRKIRNLTVGELANKVGIDQSYLSNIERCTRRNPSLTIIEGLAKALDVSIDILLNNDIGIDELSEAIAQEQYNKKWDGNISSKSCNIEKMKPTPIFMHANLQEGFLQEIAGFDCLPKDKTSNDNFFEMEMHDDTLLNMNIKAGDYIIAKYQIDAANGDIVIISIDGNIIVRRIHKVGANIVLTAENKDYPPIIIDSFEKLHIIGKLVGAKIFYGL